VLPFSAGGEKALKAFLYSKGVFIVLGANLEFIDAFLGLLAVLCG